MLTAEKLIKRKNGTAWTLTLVTLQRQLCFYQLCLKQTCLHKFFSMSLAIINDKLPYKLNVIHNTTSNKQALCRQCDLLYNYAKDPKSAQASFLQSYQNHHLSSSPNNVAAILRRIQQAE